MNWLLICFVINFFLFIEVIMSFFIYIFYLMFKCCDVVYFNNDYGGFVVVVVIRKFFNMFIFYIERVGMVFNGKVLCCNLKFKFDCLVVFNEDIKLYVYFIVF